jgi:hypothetical protein
LLYLLVLRSFGSQPQRDVGGLHRLPHHSPQVVVQGLQVSLVYEFRREGLQGLLGVVLPPVGATVYERLDTPSQRVEQGGYQEGGGYHR